MGNTALGAATAVRNFGARMIGVVPETISKAKDEKLQALGVELIKVAGGGSDLLRRATEIAAQRNAYFVHPHLDPLWTDGYQSIAEEILQTLPECRSLVFPVGGGGLLMGLAQYLKQHQAPVNLFGCEPYNYPKYANFQHERTCTIADGLILEVPHRSVQERISELDIPIALVHDVAIQLAMRDLYESQALLVEPSSAITVAMVRAVERLQEPICVVLTGQNITRDDFDRLTTDLNSGPGSSFE
jgi:threonine dehydratase